MSLDYEAISVNDRCEPHEEVRGCLNLTNLTRRGKQTGREARPAETDIYSYPLPS